ncbi:DivIVA domain-containing protein [Nocardioidaceae bacterium]|nr:DivIVA domain-containing protein [Nocardioidaceae bacterium]
MPLTPEDVSSKRFTPVRLREGYEMGEVDQFLDEVEAELQRLIRENDDLRKQVEAAGGEAPTQQPADDEKQKKADEQAEKKAAEEKAAAEKKAAEEKSAAAAKAGDREPRVLEEITVTTSSEASRAASRLLELATNNAEILVDEAREEAEGILSEAKSEAEEITSNAERRKNSLDEETEKRREELTAGLQKEQQELDQRVSNLRQFEQSYRDNLKNYFAEQLKQIESTRIEPQGSPSAGSNGAGATTVDVETKPNG